MYLKKITFTGLQKNIVLEYSVNKVNTFKFGC